MIFFFFGIISALSAIFFYKYMIETKDKTDKEIINQYKAISC